MARSALSASACKAPEQNSPTPVRGPNKGVASKATRRRTSPGGEASLTDPGSHSFPVPADDLLGNDLGDDLGDDLGEAAAPGWVRLLERTRPAGARFALLARFSACSGVSRRGPAFLGAGRASSRLVAHRAGQAPPRYSDYAEIGVPTSKSGA